MRLTKILFLSIIGFFLVSCFSDNNVATTDKEMTTDKKMDSSSISYEEALKIAKIEQKKASEVGFEWTTVGDLIKAADKDNKAGKVDDAIKKLIKAKEHAILGQKQAEVASNVKPLF